MNEDLLAYIKRVQAIAQNGLAYISNPFDLERYEELRSISVQMMSALSDTPVEKVTNLFAFENGYQTPKVDVRSVIFGDGKILLVKEKMDGCWSLPGGWADVGYSPSEIAVKEVREESGLIVKPLRLLAVMDKKCHPHPPSPYHCYKIFINCEIVDGHPLAGLETLGVQFFGPDELPPLSVERNTVSQIKMMFEFLDNPQKEAYFD